MGQGSPHGEVGRRALPPIRTFTVGTGIPPVQPIGASGMEDADRVADFYRRFGFSPTPERAYVTFVHLEVCHACLRT
ncbi:hypothetical protein GCM10023205_50370 [Yinghuangia aomiensis]|uniref:GNAT family N-acetyltransferase n=1 Tax=Yinghuangia aomiensis TaxID=676205 RepID=A0ABP9HRT7_9ACTN